MVGVLRTSTGMRRACVVAVLLAVCSCSSGTEAGGPSAADTVGTTTTTTTAGASSTTPSEVPEQPVLLVWASGGLPPGFATGLPGVDGIEHSTLVLGDELELLGSTDAEGAVVDRLDDGWRIPLDVLAVNQATFPAFVDGEAAAALGGLAPGEALLSETSAGLRRLGPGGTIELTTGSVTIAGVVADDAVGSAELVVGAADAARLGVTTERYVLVAHDAERAALEGALTALAGDVPLRFRSPDEARWLRHADSVAPAATMKAAFGEFAVREAAGRSVEVDPAWVADSIVRETVPILGAVTCHREALPPLRAALTELEAAGLAALVDPADYAGCYSARRIAPGQPVSHHAWGAAIDLNVDGNPRGDFETQDPRLVDAMRRNGFTWGGEWLVPDPAHYELLPP